ncbi:MAG: LytR C-terminal domain-containing protein [Bacteroidetes bacterium]|nr:LytR C-terminal domain-containing protein [Bacteroidota bacterium]
MILSLLFRFVFSHPVVAEIPAGKGRTASEKFIQINILNGAGEKKIASKAMDYFRNRGFDVVEIDNYETLVEKSFVIDRVGDLNSAKQVAFALGVPDSLIRSDIDSSLYLRSSVILGKNYQSLKPFR